MKALISAILAGFAALATAQTAYAGTLMYASTYRHNSTVSPTNGKPIVDVPEPSSVLGLLAFGALGVGSLRQRKQG
ncbi:PEP-CTERM sorting domain-containing protein [Roseofilum sp. BLCC_M114]|uniref:PEP-CTERM sorting domain-containing protein n=1 Tax=Roseofilum capinflatum BLCC-M114 TaxID=3022440 RepID=A0ABT7B4J2_9CYAN|nr:PEP-CTERM sorting domain-containing protein [Roseofilum capinflatum]MDJ1174041.1 PEP-CTERM sorting domain-containing protein [Roseofilum capinflatum BLCC-M114]